MGLWYETGNGMVKTNMARCDMNIDVYLCCPGPSLASAKDSDLKVPGIFTVAINTAYPHIRPNLWIGMDEPECYQSSLWWEPFMKIARGGYQDRKTNGNLISKCPNVFFADCNVPKNRNDLFKLRAHDVHFVWHKNTIAIALHILVWMGAKKIHLLGCDLGGSKDYYDNRVLTEEQRNYNRKLYSHIKDYLRWFSEEGIRHQVELISCTPESPINEYLPYCSLNDAILLSSSKFKSSNKPMHVLDVGKSN